MNSRNDVTIGAVLLLLACSSREVPSSFPSGSAASLSAAEVPHAEVARSLREDPPLPGSPTDGWAGLSEAEGSGAPAAHDHGASGAHDHGAAAAPAAGGFACPMHPEATSDKPAPCPKCGMKLEPKKP